MMSSQIEAHFNQMMRRRNADVPFNRFEIDGIESDGVRLHLDVIEVDSSRPTVVFVPGTSVYGLVFGDFLSALADHGFNVVSVDPRGHGRSSGERGRYTIPELVRDARAAIGYAKSRFGESVYVAGSSQGGIVAFYVAASGEPIRGAICHNLADLGHRDRFRMTAYPRVARVIAPVLRAAAAVFPESKIDIRRYFDLLSSEHTEVKERLANDPLALKQIYLRALASLASAPMPRAPEDIRTPLLVLHGTKDRIFPQHYVERLYSRLTCPKSLRVYSDRDHFVLTHDPAPVVADVAAWLEQCEG